MTEDFLREDCIDCGGKITHLIHELGSAMEKMLTCFARDADGKLSLRACPVDTSKDPPTVVSCEECPNLKDARELLKRCRA
jgi:hypothetical protein